jgi:glycosyltransferase involved in cell wall biosynthesis
VAVASAAGLTHDMAAPPLVSAIVSTYRSERFIKGCLEDLEAQSIGSRIEIIVVDSGSPEREGDIVRDFQSRYSNITYLRTERETVYQAWNRAIASAKGDYLTNANTDDRHAPDAYERLVAALQRHPGVALAYADCAVTVAPGLSFADAPRVAVFAWPESDPRLLFKVNFIGPQPMWRRDLHDRYGLFDENFVAAGDYEFWLRIAPTERFVHVAEILGLYLMSPDSIEHRNRRSDREEARIARIRHWPGKWGPRPTPGGTFLRWDWRALANRLLSGDFRSLAAIARSLR